MLKYIITMRENVSSLDLMNPQQAATALGDHLFIAAHMIGLPNQGDMITPDTLTLGTYLQTQSRHIFATAADNISQRTADFYAETQSHVAWAIEKRVPIAELTETLTAIQIATAPETSKVTVVEPQQVAAGGAKRWRRLRAPALAQPVVTSSQVA